MRIIIETIPHNNQNYETVGDYGVNEDGSIWLKVSEMGNEQMEMAVAIHELWELFLLRQKNVNLKEVDNFDTKYEEDRLRGKYTSDQEPGMDPDAPYHSEHICADIAERMFIKDCDIDWGEYSSKVMNL